MELFQKIRVNMAVNAILTTVIGILFILNPHGASSTIALIAGIVILIAGIGDIVRYISASQYGMLAGGGLVAGIIKCLLGIFAVTHTGTIITLLSFVLSIFVILSGINCIESSAELRRAQVPGWEFNAILSVVILAAGAFMLFFPFSAVSTAIRLAGIILVVDGLTELFTAYRLKRIGKEVRDKRKEEQDERDGNIIDM